ncbi:MAG: transcription-repair coupling factor [Chloroflexi bacterium]|nr:transcription-repair coupling factor [Chloroflexota bacterium]
MEQVKQTRETLNLSGMLSFVEQAPEFTELLELLKKGRGNLNAVVLDSALPAFIAALHRSQRKAILLLTASPERVRRVAEQILSWKGSDNVHALPEPDILPYERLSSDQATEWERLNLLCAISGETSPIVVASAAACAARTMARAQFTSSVSTIKPGMKLNLEETLRHWQSLGYEPAEEVEVPGTFSRRGGILDVYSPSSSLPVRIELFGEEVESLRMFDPATQLSREPIAEATIIPARELLVPGHNGKGGAGKALSLPVMATTQESKLGREARRRIEEDLSNIEEGRWFAGAEFYAPLFNTGSVTEYLPAETLVVWDNPQAISAALDTLDGQGAEMRQERVNAGELPADFPSPYFSRQELEQKLSTAGTVLRLLPWEGHGEDVVVLPFVVAQSFGGKLEALVEEAQHARSDGRRVVLVSQQAARLSELLGEKGILAAPTHGTGDTPAPGSITVAQGTIPRGWVLKGALTVLGDVEIFGSAKEQRIPVKRPVHRQLLRSEISPGDYVVHIDHGVGMFTGVTTMRNNGVEREYLTLEYAGGDKLYVPVDSVDRVSRYVGGATPILSRLRTHDWSRVKERVQKSVADMAQELLQLYASREVVTGVSFPHDSPWQAQLEASFPHVETRDQLTAVETVKDEMEKGRPMDRLICGDVGYGKTEVALRAAFKAVTGGKQVAILVPTTVLAQQHYVTFTERLRAFPVKVEMLSRFRTEKEQQEALKGLSAGTVDIVIGTHRLLQKDVAFKDLGLVIIDEEQRFGVAHKETLKRMRREVDVLTLSATPIPRTLHMALAGVRDMSLVETPPEERLPIKTLVGQWDNRTVREAILREMKRNGQVLMVHNRVQSIQAIAAEIGRLVPECRIAIAHGQMPEDELEDVMTDFVSGKSDLLLCTTIIESGLDMPRANTLIVKDAERLGLTQLYQLRGRVGRGSLRAYAYFLYHGGGKLTRTAEERLNTISQASELGAGFQVAMKDLEIRGAGNLLGAEQSGHIAAVGFTLYCHMLEEAVSELREKQTGVKTKKPSLLGPNIDLPVGGYLSHEYVSDLATRLALYHRLAEAQDEQGVDAIDAELRDRFGPVPLQAQNLLYVAKVRLAAMRAGVESIVAEENQIVVRLKPGKEQRLQFLGAVYGSKIKVLSNQIRLDISRLEEKWRELLSELLTKLSKA